MKKHLLTLAGVLGLLMAAGSAHAQSVNVKANVPFDFKIVNKLVPAGQYQLVSNGSLDSDILRLVNAKGGTLALITTSKDSNAKPADHTVLVFHRYGDNYFLAGMTSSGHSIRWEFPRGKAEMEVARVSQASDVLVASTGR